jgi:hypothetical protein
VSRLFEGPWRPHVAFAHTSPSDDAGRVTLGLNAGIDFAPVKQAMFKVAMVNARMPRWHIATHDDPRTGQSVDSGCAMNLADFDLVLAADEENLADLRRLDRDGVHRDKIRLLIDYCVEKEATHVPDPYYGGQQGFEVVADLVEDACAGLLEEIRGKLA